MIKVNLYSKRLESQNLQCSIITFIIIYLNADTKMLFLNRIRNYCSELLNLVVHTIHVYAHVTYSDYP